MPNRVPVAKRRAIRFGGVDRRAVLDELQVRIVFMQEKAEFSLLELAQLSVELQRLMAKARRIAEDYPAGTYDTKSALYVERSVRPSEPLEGSQSLVYIRRIRYNSPLEIVVALVAVKKIRKRLRQILEAFKSVISLNLGAQKQALVNEAARQKVITAALKNYGLSSKIAKGIKDPNERAIFQKTIAEAIWPFADGRHPRISSLAVVGQPREALPTGDRLKSAKRKRRAPLTT